MKFDYVIAPSKCCKNITSGKKYKVCGIENNCLTSFLFKNDIDKTTVTLAKSSFQLNNHDWIIPQIGQYPEMSYNIMGSSYYNKFDNFCAIHKITPKIKNKLDLLGYTYDDRDDTEEQINIILTDTSGLYRNAAKIDFINKNVNVIGQGVDYLTPIIDCDDNEELFMALAAMNNHNDYMQYFMYNDGRLIQSEKYDYRETDYKTENYRKATKLEIINHLQK